MEKRSTFPHVTHFTDRHGKLRWRFRKDGLTVSLGTDYGSADFIKKYNAAVKGERVAPRQATGAVLSGSQPGSLSAVIDGWYKTAAFTKLSASTSTHYRNTLENIRKLHGTKLVADLQRRHIKALMAAKVQTPNAANFDLRMLRLVLDHAVDLEIVRVNEARGVKKYGVQTDGHHTWTEAEILEFYNVHPAGSVARTAMTLMLYTGAARSDVVTLGWHSILDGRLMYRRQKMKTRNGVLVSIPVHPALAECISDLPRDHGTFLQVPSGEPRSPNGLGNMMREWCDTAVLPECSSHGLRKACARRLIEAGATPHEMMAVTGHKTLIEAQRYAETFDRNSAADRAVEKQTSANLKRVSHNSEATT